MILVSKYVDEIWIIIMIVANIFWVSI